VLVDRVDKKIGEKERKKRRRFYKKKIQAA
jgi:hypothetical protein